MYKFLQLALILMLFAGKNVLMFVFQWVIPIWTLSILVASGLIKLPFNNPFLDDLLMWPWQIKSRLQFTCSLWSNGKYFLKTIQLTAWYQFEILGSKIIDLNSTSKKNGWINLLENCTDIALRICICNLVYLLMWLGGFTCGFWHICWKLRMNLSFDI